MGVRVLWFGAWAIWGLFACSHEQGLGEHGDDGFAVGTLPLQLPPSPPGLCGGDGSAKECGPQGCAEAPAGPPVGPARPSGIGQAPPAPPAQPSFQPAPAPPGAPIPAPVPAPPVIPPVVPPPGQAPVPMCSDGISDAGVATCGDAGVAAAQAALGGPDVPQCAMVRPARASTLYLSADDSNSMAGPVIARSMIRQGRRVPAHVVRPWEFLNYYDFDFAPAAPGEVRIVPQLSSCPDDDRLSLQVALSAEARAPRDRAALTLTFVIDTSGSMGTANGTGESPIQLARAAVQAMASQLQAGDVVSIVTWNTSQQDILAGHMVNGPNDAALLAAARGLVANGGTDLQAGLLRGYELAEAHYGTGRVNRVVIISDGVANVGVTDEALIARHADDEEGEAGIYLAGIGVGDGVNDTLMNAVTDAGRGAYVFLDSSGEAQRVLGERFLQVVDLAVRNVRLEVTLPYHLVIEKFFGEVASTDASKVRPQHMAPNDAMLFFQVLRACEPSLLRGDDRIRIRATWETPNGREQRSALVDTTLNALAGDDDDLTKAAAIAGYAEALVAVASTTDVDGQRRLLMQALADVQTAKDAAIDPDLLEVAELLNRYLDQFPAPAAP